MTHKIKAINVSKRLHNIAKPKEAKKNSSIQNLATELSINQLYSIDFFLDGVLQTNVTARYDGISTTGRSLKFELSFFYTAQNKRMRSLYLKSVPAKIIALNPNDGRLYMPEAA